MNISGELRAARMARNQKSTINRNSLTLLQNQEIFHQPAVPRLPMTVREELQPGSDNVASQPRTAKLAKDNVAALIAASKTPPAASYPQPSLAPQPLSVNKQTIQTISIPPTSPSELSPRISQPTSTLSTARPTVSPPSGLKSPLPLQPTMSPPSISSRRPPPHFESSTEGGMDVQGDRYSKYRKMLAMNLPEGAVRQKMNADGLGLDEQQVFFAASFDSQSSTGTQANVIAAAQLIAPAIKMPPSISTTPSQPIIPSAAMAPPHVRPLPPESGAFSSPSPLSTFSPSGRVLHISGHSNKENSLAHPNPDAPIRNSIGSGFSNKEKSASTISSSSLSSTLTPTPFGPKGTVESLRDGNSADKTSLSPPAPPAPPASKTNDSSRRAGGGEVEVDFEDFKKRAPTAASSTHATSDRDHKRSSKIFLETLFDEKPQKAALAPENLFMASRRDSSTFPAGFDGYRNSVTSPINKQSSSSNNQRRPSETSTATAPTLSATTSRSPSPALQSPAVTPGVNNSGGGRKTFAESKEVRQALLESHQARDGSSGSEVSRNSNAPSAKDSGSSLINGVPADLYKFDIEAFRANFPPPPMSPTSPSAQSSVSTPKSSGYPQSPIQSPVSGGKKSLTPSLNTSSPSQHNSNTGNGSQSDKGRPISALIRSVSTGFDKRRSVTSRVSSTDLAPPKLTKEEEEESEKHQSQKLAHHSKLGSVFKRSSINLTPRKTNSFNNNSPREGEEVKEEGYFGYGCGSG